jgi:hypothetical protein
MRPIRDTPGLIFITVLRRGFMTRLNAMTPDLDIPHDGGYGGAPPHRGGDIPHD